jgi:hypothetical protein
MCTGRFIVSPRGYQPAASRLLWKMSTLYQRANRYSGRNGMQRRQGRPGLRNRYILRLRHDRAPPQEAPLGGCRPGRIRLMPPHPRCHVDRRLLRIREQPGRHRRDERRTAQAGMRGAGSRPVRYAPPAGLARATLASPGWPPSR